VETSVGNDPIGGVPITIPGAAGGSRVVGGCGSGNVVDPGVVLGGSWLGVGRTLGGGIAGVGVPRGGVVVTVPGGGGVVGVVSVPGGRVVGVPGGAVSVVDGVFCSAGGAGCPMAMPRTRRSTSASLAPSLVDATLAFCRRRWSSMNWESWRSGWQRRCVPIRPTRRTPRTASLAGTSKDGYVDISMAATYREPTFAPTFDRGEIQRPCGARQIPVCHLATWGDLR